MLSCNQYIFKSDTASKPINKNHLGYTSRTEYINECPYFSEFQDIAAEQNIWEHLMSQL